jgi:hypothetical protein
MDITIYLPDELGKWAKENDLPLSRMLRDAVESEKRRRAAVEKTLGEATTHELAVEEPDGYGGSESCTVRLHGALIAETDYSAYGSVRVYLGQDDKIYVHDETDGQLRRDVEPGDLAGLGLSTAAYLGAMRALGEEVVIDVGLPE